MSGIAAYRMRTKALRRIRGSTFILVLAVLSILVLIAATLSYTARLEELSARNFAGGIQARMAAATGVGTFFSFYDGRTSGVLEPWLPPTPAAGNPAPWAPMSQPSGRTMGTRPIPPLSALSGGANSMPPPRPPAAGIPAQTTGPLGPMQPRRPDFRFAETDNLSQIETNLIRLRIYDESAKININALGTLAELGEGDIAASRNTGPDSPATTASIPVGPPVGLAAAIYAVLSSPQVNYSGASPAMARELARAIILYRYGPDGRPGRAGIDDDGDGPGGVYPGGATAVSQGRSLYAAGGGRNFATSDQRLPGAGNALSGMPLRPGAKTRPAGTPLNKVGQPAATASASTGYSINIESDGLDNDFDGAVDEVGEGIDEPDEFIADPRLRPYGDDRPFRRVEDLLLVPGMTPELYLALKPYVTVFSASERRVGPGRHAPAPVDLNVASDVEIYERLRVGFPGVSPETCARFAANIADYRDADSVPTRVQLEGTPIPILGLEVTPYITEVWPQSVTDRQDGDDGQYIEIHNPYDIALSIDGWSVRIQGGSRVNLRGVLVPGAYLIITDDYNEAHDPSPEDDFANYGSFYDIFHAVPNHRDRLLVEEPTLEIPDKNGKIELFDAAGNLIDFFYYGGGLAGGLTRSYQRPDPRVRLTQVARCTPFAAMGQARDHLGIAHSANLLSAAEIRNAPFQSALELFHIGCPYQAGQQTEGTPSWRTPSIGSVDPGTFDERLVDLFTVWTNRPPRQLAMQRGLWSDVLTTTATIAAAAPSSLTECGRININTAPPTLLRALPGITDRQIDYILVQRAVAPRLNQVGIPIVYSCWSELLADNGFWATAPQQLRLEQTARWLNSISFDSRSYQIVSENVRERTSGPRLASRSKIEAVLALDGGENQVVSWRFLE